MVKIMQNRFLWGFVVGSGVVCTLVLLPRILDSIRPNLVEAAQERPPGMFVNLINFPPVKAGKDAEFLEWFRWSNEIYAKHKGFVSRTLLKPIDGGATYAAIVEHESKETFMAMHMSQNREEAYNRVAPLLQGKPTPHFFEVVVSYKK